MQLKYRGTAYTPKAQTTIYPFTTAGCYRGQIIQLGGSQQPYSTRFDHTLPLMVYRGQPIYTNQKSTDHTVKVAGKQLLN